MNNEFSRDDLFKAWMSDIREVGTGRFLAKNRAEILSSLVESLFENGVEKEDAMSLSRRVRDFLVTEEGKKGKGKHADWTKNVVEEYEGMVVSHYLNNRKKADIVKDYGNGPFLPYNPIITAWAKNEYGPVWTDHLNLLVHMIGHRFNQEFQAKVMDSKWVITGENVPEWAERLFKA